MENNKKTFLKEIVGEENLKFESSSTTDTWEHSCRYNGIIAVGKNSPCNWCGQSEDGTFD